MTYLRRTGRYAYRGQTHYCRHSGQVEAINGNHVHGYCVLAYDQRLHHVPVPDPSVEGPTVF